MFQHFFKLFCLALLFSLNVSSAGAATKMANFNVTATVGASCKISAVDLAFGSYDPSSATPLDQTTTVTVKCTKTTPWEIGLSAGGVGTYIDHREMTGTLLDKLNYNLYTDSGRTAVWGPVGGGFGSTVSGTGNGSDQSQIVYGRMPIDQYVTADSYTDIIVATVSY